MPNYNETLDELQAEMSRLTKERMELDKRLINLHKAIEAIRVLAEESDMPINAPPMSEDQEAGFTDKVKAVLRANAARYLSAMDIRDILIGNDLQDVDSKVVLIHIHNTLKRLHKQEQVDADTNASGKRVYRWRNQNSLRDLMLGDFGTDTVTREAFARLAASMQEPVIKLGRRPKLTAPDPPPGATGKK